MTQKSTLHANFLLLQKALAVWSPVGDTAGEQGGATTAATTTTTGGKSPESSTTATSPPATTESAVVAGSASATMAVTGSQAGPLAQLNAHWMSAVMAEHIADNPYWQNGSMEVGNLILFESDWDFGLFVTVLKV